MESGAARHIHVWPRASITLWTLLDTVMDTGWWGHFLILYNDNFTFRNVYSFNDLGILKFYRLKFENCAGKWSCFKVKSCYSYYSYYCRLLWLLYYCYLWFLLYLNRIFRWETVGAVDGVLQVTSRWEEVTISARSLLTATTLLSLVSFDSYSVFYCSTRSRCFYLKKGKSFQSGRFLIVVCRPSSW